MTAALSVLLVSQEYPPATTSGGIGTQTSAKAAGLAALGHDVTVLSHSLDGDVHDAVLDGVRVRRIPGPDALLPVHTDAARWAVWSALVAAEVARLTDERRVDLVEFAEWGAEGYVHLLGRTPWHPVPTVVQLHGPVVMVSGALGWPDPGSDFYRVARHMEETCLRLADRVYSSSETSLQWVREAYGLALPDAEVVHSGVDVTRFRPGTPASVPTVVSAGKLSPSKGTDVLVDACTRLVAHGVPLRLRLVGTGEPEFLRSLRERASAAGLDLDLAGYVGHDRLPALLADAHVFAAPSRYEGGPGLVLLEAMACGLPVVACSGSGAAESVRPDTGVLVPPGSPTALATALQALLTDEEHRGRLGRRARKHVVATAATPHCLDRIAALYREVVERSRVAT